MLISCLTGGKVPTVRNCIQLPLGGLTRLEAPLPKTSVELANPAVAVCVPRASSFEDSDPPPRHTDGRAPRPDAPSTPRHAGGVRGYGHRPRAAPSDRHMTGDGLASHRDGRRRHSADTSGLGLSGNGGRACLSEPDLFGVGVPLPAEESDSAQWWAWCWIVGDADRPANSRPAESARTK